MRKKILEDRITLKHQKIYLAAQTAASYASHTAFAHLAESTKANHLQQLLKVGFDLMGNDNAPQTLLDELKKTSIPSGVELVAIATPEYKEFAHPFSFVEAPEFIGMDEHPLLSLRKKRNASICVGLRLLKENKIDAFVSAGNTGALVTSAKMILTMLPQISRPALIALMPTKKNPVAVLDVGANVEVKARVLVQFAELGIAYQKARGITNPTVGLLNIGIEAIKGTSELRLAYHELKSKKNIQFKGNIEGTSVFDGDVDVLVTDGFTGNVFLKTAEGIASLILDKLQNSTTDVKKFQSLHYEKYPGAVLAGVRGIVIKCHGYSTPKGYKNAVLGAIELAKNGFVKKLMNDLY